MGNERRRVERLLLLTNTQQLPTLQVGLQEHPGMRVAVAPTDSLQQLQSQLQNPNPVAQDGLYIIDPMGMSDVVST